MKLSNLQPNIGQLEGLPANPRYITQEEFDLLKLRIIKMPQYLRHNPLKVEEHGVVLGGNQRYAVLIALAQEKAVARWVDRFGVEHTHYFTDEIPDEWIANCDDYTLEDKQRIVLLDNTQSGEDDLDRLANEWDHQMIKDWGNGLPEDWNQGGEEDDEDLKVEDDEFNEEEEYIEPRTKEGDIWQLGEHRLLCGDSCSKENIVKLMNGTQARLWLTDPPYNVNVKNSQNMKIANDNMESQLFGKFLRDAFSAAEAVLEPGGSFYIWYASREHINFEKAINAVGLQVREQLIWNKNSLVLGRQDYQWKHEPCQPAGTMVLTTQGEKPIEELTEKDRVIAYNPNRSQVLGYKNGGYAIKTANRDYDGLLYTINVDGKTTRATDNHMFSVRFNAAAKKNYCTYLMRRGNWWRVGITKAYDARQFGLKTRYHQEKAEEMWLLGVYEDKVQAQVAEQIIAVKYGIPYTIWEFDRFAKTPNRSNEQIKQIYDALDLNQLKINAHKLLHDFGRSERFPLINQETKAERFSTRVTAKIHACNIIPEIMQLPIPRDPAAHKNFEFVSVDNVSFAPYQGKVYSLAVETHEHYIADGICTHNCLYGWKDGAAHYFTESRNRTSVIQLAQSLTEKDIEKMKKEDMAVMLKAILALPTSVINANKPNKNTDHPTMKPLELFGELMKNSSVKGDPVLDTFGGSGTTLICAEQLKRKCYMVELDPHYCDVIIARWEKLTGKEAVKL